MKFLNFYYFFASFFLIIFPILCQENADDSVLRNLNVASCPSKNSHYQYDELRNPIGPNRCANDCECQGLRRCSPEKYCKKCMDLVLQYPWKYSVLKCVDPPHY